MSMEKVIYKKLGENNKAFRIQANIGQLSLSLIILEEIDDEFNAYKTSLISEHNLKKQADQRGIEINLYFEKLISFFENPEKVIFRIDKETLVISESVNKNIRANYFRCDLYKVEHFASFMGAFVDEIQIEILKLQKSNFELSERFNLIDGEVQEYKTKLTEFVERKNVDEQVMLSNFVTLLNEKKRRIQHLYELLQAFETNPTLANPVEVNVSYNSKRKRTKINKEEPSCSRFKEVVSDSSSSSNHDGYITDNEEGEEAVEVKLKKSVEFKSQVTHECFDDIFEESPKPLLKLPSISREVSDTKSVNSTNDNSVKTKLSTGKSEMEHPQSNCSNTAPVDINTQDWLNEL